MLNNYQIGLLKKFVKKELGEDADIFDAEAHIDKTLDYKEAKNELREKIKYFREDLEEQVRDIKAERKEEAKEFFNLWSEKHPYDAQKIAELFKSPNIIGVIADANTGKSNLLYYLVKILRKKHKFNLYSFGLKMDVGEKKIYSLKELEQVKNSIVFIDEFYSLFDMDNRKKKRMIEKTLRLIFHNNNVLVLCGLPENFKKFLSNKLNITFYGKSTIGDFINGSRAKYDCLDYMGIELGSSILDLPPSKFIIYDGKHYHKLNVPYLEEYDTKKDNEDILKKKKKEKK